MKTVRRKLVQVFLVTAFMTIVGFFGGLQLAQAQTPPTPAPNPAPGGTPAPGGAQPAEGGTKVDTREVTQRETCNGDDCSQLTIVKNIQAGINFLSAMVAVVVVIMIVMGGIQYSAAGGNPQATAAAKHRILNAILALVAYIFLFTFIQWLVPGGIF